MTKTEQRIRELEAEAKVLERILDTSGDDLPEVETELCAIYKELAGYEKMTGTRFFVSAERPTTQDAEGFEALNWTEFGRKEIEMSNLQYSLMHYRIKYILVKENIENWLIKNVTSLFKDR